MTNIDTEKLMMLSDDIAILTNEIEALFNENYNSIHALINNEKWVGYTALNYNNYISNEEKDFLIFLNQLKSLNGCISNYTHEANKILMEVKNGRAAIDGRQN